MSKEEESLRDIIEGDLKTQIEEIWRKAKKYHSSQMGDTIQDTSHCETVEKNLFKLISKNKEKELKQIDLFMLSAAACLHDIGKVVDKNAKRWVGDHGERSRQIILEKYEKLGLDRGQAIVVALIVSVHDQWRLDKLPDNPFPVGNDEFNIIELASVFRLADMLDTNYQRAPEILSDIKFYGGEIPSKWRGRQSIISWYLDENNRIIFKVIPKKEEINAVCTLWGMMKEEISKIAPFLKLNGYPCELGELDTGDIFLELELKKGAVKRRPFPGMGFYGREDAAIFKGRDHEIEQLLYTVSAWPITVLIGGSGAGKTSIIHAGLFPRLEKMSWKFVWTRPFDNPMENIKEMIWNEFFQGKPDNRTLLDVMKLAAEKCKSHKLLVVIDQFEDVLDCKVQDILDEFSLTLVAVYTGTVIPNLRLLISFREDALVKLNSRLLKRVTGSARQFPSVELEQLTNEGAKSAFEAGLKHGGIGLDPRQERGEMGLLEMILDDIPKEGDRLYPPYLQIVAETLCKKVDKSNPIITREMYSELGYADNIIARYLMEQLNEFGPHREKAEKVLVSLTSSAGEKMKKSLSELSRKTEIGIKELKMIINKMIDLRMARAVGENEFEIIHDYLGKIADEELVEEEDRTIKFLEEQLNAFYQTYKMHKAPIISLPFLANLYRNRRKIKIDKEKYPFILCTALFKGSGLGWYWIGDLDVKEILEMIKDHVSHEIEEIRNQAMIALAKIGDKEDRNKIIEMLYDRDKNVREAAIGALAKIGDKEDRNKIIEMLYDGDKDVRRAAIGALAKIVQPDDRNKIIEMLYNGDRYVREAAIGALAKIVQPDDRNKIIGMLHDRDKNVREAAIGALAKIVQPDDRNKIIGMLHNRDENVRIAAIGALAKIGNPEDRDRIIEMLYDEDKNVREAAIGALAKIGNPEDRDRIIGMLNNRDKDVRIAAIGALAKIGNPEDRDRIIEMLYDEDKDVRRVAVGAFKKTEEMTTKEYLLDLLSEKAKSWSDENIVAIESLSQLDKKFYCPYS